MIRKIVDSVIALAYMVTVYTLVRPRGKKAVFHGCPFCEKDIEYYDTEFGWEFVIQHIQLCQLKWRLRNEG